MYVLIINVFKIVIVISKLILIIFIFNVWKVDIVIGNIFIIDVMINVILNISFWLKI